jgi:hypothetical protein
VANAYKTKGSLGSLAKNSNNLVNRVVCIFNPCFFS